ncbi:hypothetical protein NP493_660g03003 [Ridgeia piscesae]|uniref:Uncharacterized protein n=1 Tax=Ridgeia piscesae TaxID=27915 RepID=A0AAD9NQ49_RIDPI|nr:hypothetical protein NP493_660g03003 [Ridgeia piscesae]
MPPRKRQAPKRYEEDNRRRTVRRRPADVATVVDVPVLDEPLTITTAALQEQMLQTQQHMQAMGDVITDMAAASTAVRPGVTAAAGAAATATGTDGAAPMLAVAGVLTDRRLLVLSDNEAVVHIINNQTSKDKQLMSLIRTLTVSLMQNNVILRAKHVPGKTNVIADALSRFQDTPDLRRQPGLKPVQSVIPPDLLPWPL